MSAAFDNVEVIAEVATGSPKPLTVTELAAALNRHLEVDHIDGRWVARQIERSAGRLELTGDGTVAVVEQGVRPEPVDAAGPGRPLRAVAVDFETLPRHAGDGTLQRVPIEAGALRFGRDEAWVAASPPLELLVAADEQLATGANADHRLLKDAIDSGLAPELVGVALAAVLEGADVVVAYNGVEVDFPVLDSLLAHADTSLEQLAIVTVDGLYLAHAVLPDRTPVLDGHGAHQLASVAVRVRISGTQTHRALADCRLLADVLEGLATEAARLPTDVTTLLAALTRTSHAWALLFDLSSPGTVREPVAAEVARAGIDALTAALPDRRTAGAAPPTLTVPEPLRTGGKVDPFALASVLAEARGRTAGRRAAQEATAAHVAAAVASGTDALIEAPTGSGKSLVLLAAALDWIDADPDRRAVISTYTRALQTQLAGDLELLTGAVPGLDEQVDLVKGAANRLSLRALSTAAVGLASSAPFRHGIGRRRASDPAFAEVVAYLLLRLYALGPDSSLVTRWNAWSVDTDDLPAVFDTFTDGRLGGLLAEVSQKRSGDYAQDDHAALAAKTVKVREALADRRLIVANHALLCSASSVLVDMSTRGQLLLLADEAHELESAATSTLSASFSTADLDRLRGDLVAVADAVRPRLTPDDLAAAPDDDSDGAVAARLVAAVARLDQVIDDELLSQRLAVAFNMRAGSDPTLARRRQQVVIAESDADLGQLAIAAELEPIVRLLSGLLGGAAAGLEVAATMLPADRHDEVATLQSRTSDTFATLAALSADLAELAGTRDDDGDGDAGVGGPDADGLDHDPAPPGHASNRIVWAAELPLQGRQLARFLDSGMRLRHWPVEVTTTPVAVADDPRFTAFRNAFAVSVFVSGTLTVPGAADPWQFICDRLGLDGHVARHVVDSDFDPATQARLVAFTDFPSWGEQTDAAVATVAWQVDRYARQVVTDGRHGAMVLTTSRAHAGQISDALGKLRRSDDRFGVHDAVLDGNQRALASFREDGGVLIGTRGLWQGVDVEAERIRLVWINKLPFPPVGDPIIDVRRARVEAAAREAGSLRPDQDAKERYYLPLAAMALRQAAGRLLRSTSHRGVVVISDAKLSGDTSLRRLYRRFFLASLPGYAVPDETGEIGAGNLATMEDGWRRIFAFLATPGSDPERTPAAISAQQAAEWSEPDALAEHVWLPHTRRVLAARYTDDDEVAAEKAAGRFADSLKERAREVGGALNLSDGPLEALRDAQVEALDALADGRDVLALLPTGYGKSFLFQLPGLILPGVTIVVSPLVSLMTDQAMKLNRTVGGRVRALTGPMAESNSRLGKTQVHQQLTGEADHDIKLIYLAPERFATTQFQQMVRAGVKAGIVRRIAVDEAHTLAAWGDTFRPQMRRAEHFIRRLRQDFDGAPQLLAVTATATRSVRRHLTTNLFAAEESDVTLVHANPVRADMAIHKRLLNAKGRAGEQLNVLLVEKLLEVVDGHAIVYATRIADVEEIHTYLTAQLGRRRRVLKYHSKLSDLEKASVSEFFAAAPTVDDPDGFEPMVVVATKAFGLGIDRPDIRLVIAASPPGDLAELYQALGRAGRDQADRDPADAPVPTAGIAVLTPSSWSTLRYFNRYDTDHDRLVRRFVDRFKTAESPVEIEQLVGEVIDDRVARGELSPQLVERTRDRIEETYTALAVRTFAALSAVGNLEDLGNSPAAATISPGERSFAEAADAGRQAAAVIDALSDQERRDGVELTELYARLSDGAFEATGDVSAMWFELLQLDNVGLLEVRQITASGGFRTQLNFRRADHWRDDTRLVDELARLHRERSQDLQQLREWFVNDTDCALSGIAEFFAVDHWQRGACDHDHTRCSVCWQDPAHAGTPRPAVLDTLLSDERSLAAGAAALTRTAQRRLEQAAAGILSDVASGMGVAKLLAAIRGQDRIYISDTFSKPVPRGALRSRHFGQVTSADDSQLRAVLARLIADGTVVRVTIVDGEVVEAAPSAPGAYYRHARHQRGAA
ncbi:DEAD/DEAH box helicase [Nitriliruptor alkaliphilus]|uniref:DEAD/DEAH box helicase n=1 Tax=Nitriliruptor alkaliphilus TaxID=427918 RepID=UPI000696AC96|nr:DEAD/DEAH box helicase [Nitriliruptor alkaliphilus]